LNAIKSFKNPLGRVTFIPTYNRESIRDILKVNNPNIYYESEPKKIGWQSPIFETKSSFNKNKLNMDDIYTDVAVNAPFQPLNVLSTP